MTTPLLRLSNNIFAKLEAFNAGGSHKIRAAKRIVQRAVQEGQIIPHKTTVIEKTGGNFGVGLIHACNDYNLDIELAVGLSFSLKRRKFLEALGAKLIGQDMLEAGATPKEVVEYHLENAQLLGKSYFYSDQFNNYGSVEGHSKSTGVEIAHQLERASLSKDIIFVSCAGTGASLMGIRESLIDYGYRVQTCLVEPEGCDTEKGEFIDHRFEGMSVGVIPPFVDWSVIDQKIGVSFEEALNTQKSVARKQGHFIGNTSAACIHAAHTIEKTTPNTSILTMIYDHGAWYNDLTGSEA